MHTEFWWGNFKVRDNLHEQVLREEVIINFFFRSRMELVGLDLCVLAWGQVEGCCECGHSLSESATCGEFLD